MIDWSRVKELHAEVGAEDFDEIRELFLEEVEAVLAKLDAATDCSALGDDLHFLKGSATSLGFAQLSDLCMAGEKMANAGQAESIELGLIFASYAQSKEVFLADLPAQLQA